MFKQWLGTQQLNYLLYRSPITEKPKRCQKIPIFDYDGSGFHSSRWHICTSVWNF